MLSPLYVLESLQLSVSRLSIPTSAGRQTSTRKAIPARAIPKQARRTTNQERQETIPAPRWGQEKAMRSPNTVQAASSS
jgi:hypothetical protein